MSVLTIMLTDACNCNCSYCYQKILSNNNIGDFKKEWVERLDSILPDFDEIHFFGGEPLLQEEVIFKLSEKVESLMLVKKIEKFPIFSFSTNLTFLSKKFKSFLINSRKCGRKVNFIITVDGRKDIHDKNRTMVCGESSYERIKKNYKFLIANGMNISTIYIVYNKTHINNKMSLRDCIECVIDEFPYTSYIVFNYESFLEQTKISENTFEELKYNLTDLIFQDIISKKSELKKCVPFLLYEIFNIYSSIITEQSDKTKCVMEGKKLSILPDGSIYMCTDQYYYGQRSIASLQEKTDLKQIYQTYVLPENRKNVHCEQCNIKLLCRLCPIKSEYKKDCERNKKYYTMVLDNLKKIYGDLETAKYFIWYLKLPKEIFWTIYERLLKKE